MKSLSHINKGAFPIKSRLKPGNADWLIKILGISGKDLPAIRKEVGEMIREENLENGDSPKRDIHRRVSSRLIKRSALRTAAVGGITATPAILPVIGTIGTAVISTTADFTYLIRKQIELCYQISAVYDTGIHEQELRAITLALIGFSGTGQMAKGIAASTLRSVVDATTATYLKKGVAGAAAEVAAKLSPRVFGRAYKLIPLLGIPLSASINIASTMMVGKQARKYFCTFDEGEASELRAAQAPREVTKVI